MSLRQLCRIHLDDGASTIYGENASRCIAIKYSVRGRDLGSTVLEAMQAVSRRVKFNEGYRLDWTGEYESQQRANRRLMIVVPVTVLLMMLILYHGVTERTASRSGVRWSSLARTGKE